MWETWPGWNMLRKALAWHSIQGVATWFIQLHTGLKERNVVCEHYGEKYQLFYCFSRLNLWLSLCWDLFYKSLDWHCTLWVPSTSIPEFCLPTHVKEREDEMNPVVWDPGGINFCQYSATTYHLAIPRVVVCEWKSPLWTYSGWGDSILRSWNGEPSTHLPLVNHQHFTWDPGGIAQSSSLPFHAIMPS